MKYTEPESSTIEFKRVMPPNLEINKSIIGFCNQYGGKLIIGIADDGTIIGVPESDVDDIMTKASQLIYNGCHPPIIPLVYAQRIQDKIIVIIEVSGGLYKPYFLKSKGLHEGTYIRLGSTTVLANNEMVHELQWQSQGHTPDQSPVYTASISDLDQNAAKSLLNNHPKAKLDPDAIKTLLKGHGLIVEEHTKWYPTIAGILLFSNRPEQFISEAFIICSHFAGTTGRQVIATRDCEGSLFQQFSDAYSWILSRLNRSFAITGPVRSEKYEVPVDAIREIVMNAIVHRSYQYKSPIKIAIYDNRIEIFSPGNFPGPLKTDQLEFGFTYMRNPIICKLFRKKGLIEKLGSGFTLLFERYREWQLPTPTVVEGTGFVKCILPRPSIHGEPIVTRESREEKILRLLTTSLEIETSDIEKLLSVSKPTAIRAINKLVNQNILERIGKGPAVKYRLIKNRNPS